jgi:hypothetical protein
LFLGGTISQSVEGASLDSISLVNSTPGQVTAVDITTSGTGGVSLAGKTTTMTITAGGGTATSDATIACTDTSVGSDGTAWNCPVAGGDYYTQISAISVTVV